jgi:hypothetical protein
MRFGKSMLSTSRSFSASGRAEHEWRAHGAGRDAADADPGRREVARHWQRHPEDGGLGRSVGELAGLLFDAGDRRGAHDDTPLSELVGLVSGHRRARQAGHVERTDAFISIVPMKACLSCGVPSRPTVRPPPTPPPARLRTRACRASAPPR